MKTDMFSELESVVRIEPTVNIRFLAEELRRYGIKTNSQNDKGKTVFFQSAHIIMMYGSDIYTGGDCITHPIYGLVSFKDLFTLIGKNDHGVDDQDIVRVWNIADKLEKRRMVRIKGTARELLGEGEQPTLPDVYANLHHIHRHDEHKDSYVYKSKFATNKRYEIMTPDKEFSKYDHLTGVSDFFILE